MGRLTQSQENWQKLNISATFKPNFRLLLLLKPVKIITVSVVCLLFHQMIPRKAIKLEIILENT